MPSNPPPPRSAHPRQPPAEQAAGEREAAEANLNPGHPLIVVLRSSQTLREQALTVAGLQVAGVILLWNEPLALPLALACGLVQIALGLRLMCLRSRKRAACRQLIIEGRDQLPLRSVRRELRRLGDSRHRNALARSLDELANEASHPSRAGTNPIYRPTVVRHAAAQLQQIAVLMHANDTPVRGVAHIESLLTEGQSPLYGTDIGELREELARARYFLTARRESAH